MKLFEEALVRIKLAKLYQKVQFCTSSLEIEKLYLQALKEQIKLGTNKLCFTDDFQKYYLGNCYTYALGLPSLSFFIKKYMEKEIEDIFPFNVGFMNHTPYYIYGKDMDGFITFLKQDCESLNIQIFETSEREKNAHSGYKIAMYFYYNQGIQDFHFIRQNSDGLWSHKQGYFSSPELLSSFSYTYKHYDFAGMFEIVRPVIRKLKK